MTSLTQTLSTINSDYLTTTQAKVFNRKLYYAYKRKKGEKIKQLFGGVSIYMHALPWAFLAFKCYGPSAY